MKLTATILFCAALIILGLMICPRVIACIGMVVSMLILIACCFAPFLITHPACLDAPDAFQTRKGELINGRGEVWPTAQTTKDNLSSQPTKSESPTQRTTL